MLNALLVVFCTGSFELGKDFHIQEEVECCALCTVQCRSTKSGSWLPKKHVLCDCHVIVAPYTTRPRAQREKDLTQKVPGTTWER